MRLAPQGGCVCPVCGAVRAILPKPPWLPENSHVLGFMSDEPAVAEERPREPVHVACTQCGGPLVADGSSRIVPCGYCAARVALPDAIWAALHPPRIKKRWWLAVHVADDPRRGLAGENSFARLPRQMALGGVFVAVPIMVFAGSVAVVMDWNPWAAIVGSFCAFIGVPFCLVLWAARRLAYICRPENEVIGRLYGSWGTRGADQIEVLLTPPHQAANVLARTILRDVSQQRFAELGGEGGRVRAWLIPGKPASARAEPIPSVLE
jgi:hypothetical protein